MFANFGFSQVGIGTNSPVSSAKLGVASTSQGFLPPRMSRTQWDMIGSHATGLMIFCTDCSPKGDPEFYYGTRLTSMNT